MMGKFYIFENFLIFLIFCFFEFFDFFDFFENFFEKKSGKNFKKKLFY